MKLLDINPGDIIDLPHHYPSRFTVMAFEGTTPDTRVPLTRVRWSATAGEGITTISEDAEVRLCWAAPYDAPIRQQARAATEAALESLLATLEA